MKTIRASIKSEEFERVIASSEIKMLSKIQDDEGNDMTRIHFKDGTDMVVEESMNTLEARLNKD